MTTPLPTTPDEQREFTARLAMLSAAGEFAHAFCAHRGIGPRDALRLTLIIEELFTNTVCHGYRGDCDLPIRIRLGTEGHAVRMLYEDAAPAYDPLAGFAAASSRLAEPFEARPVGGLGVVLVGELAQSARYAREDGWNRLWLTLRSAG